MAVLGVGRVHADRRYVFLCQGAETIDGRIDEKLIARFYNRIRDAYPLAVCETESEGDVSNRIARLLVRLGGATEQNHGSVERTLTVLAEATADPRPVIAGKLSLFAGEAGVCTEPPDCGRCDVSDLCAHFTRRPTIKQLPESERPRERLLRDGPEALSEADLLGIVIRGGTDKESAVDLGRRLLATFGDLRELAQRGAGELTRINGIGPAKAAQIMAVFEIAKRYASITLKPGQKFTSAGAIFEHYRHKLRDRKEEQFLVVLLDAQHKFIRDVVISVGTLNSSLVHPREVLAPAIKESAAAMIFVHNHPSGNPEPSEADIELTHRLVEAANLVGIRVLDHIVIGDPEYESFAAKGLL